MRRRICSTEELLHVLRVEGYAKYDYSNAVWTGKITNKIQILCPKHGVFYQRINDHLRGQRCPKCKFEKLSQKFRLTTKDFVSKAKLIHGDKYDYSRVQYQNDHAPITIVCPKHGEFIQRPHNHLHDRCGCPSCGNVKHLTTKDFVSKAKLIHGDKYDYSCVQYRNTQTKITIVCPKHGEFIQIPTKHLQGNGCPQCNESKGERQIRLWLEQNHIEHEYQKRFDGCRYKLPLPFDFWLPQQKMCIEYDGIQHFEEGIGNFFQGQYTFTRKMWKSLSERDDIKSQWCLENNIKLLRIAYNQQNQITQLLKRFVCL